MNARGRQGTGIWFSKRGVGFERWTDGVKAGITFPRVLEVGKWVGITATYDGARMRLFVMAFLTGSRATTAPLAPSAAPFRLGTGASTGGNFGHFNGDLDEVALYDHALTRSHIGAHGWAGVSLPCVQLPNADRSIYTPAVEELGTTVRVITNSTRSYPTGDVTVSQISESTSPTDEAGHYVRPLILTPSEGETVTGTAFLTAAVLGLPMIDRIEFLVDGVVHYAKDEAPYQYAWDTTTARNGMHTVAVRVWGPGSATPAIAQRAVTVAN
jgi:Concanavalin A-like lectin/glucanases superfamily/Bacterial Ig domain